MMTKFVRVFLQNCFADFFLLTLGVSSQLLFVTENDVKIWSILINYEIIPFIMNLLNSRYAYSNLNIEFWYTSLWRCTIHFNNENWPLNYEFWFQGKEKELTVTTPQNLVGKLAMILKVYRSFFSPSLFTSISPFLVFYFNCISIFKRRSLLRFYLGLT